MLALRMEARGNRDCLVADDGAPSLVALLRGSQPGADCETLP